MYSGTYMTDKSKRHGMAQWGPSACVRPDGVEVGALTKDMIAGIVAAYGHAAGLAKRAGFELLMVHGGHGWLINQFLSPCSTSAPTNMAAPWRTAAGSPLRC